MLGQSRNKTRHMSAYIVDKNHILYLIQAAISRRINGSYTFHWFVDKPDAESMWATLDADNHEQLADVGNMLWRENIRSVSHRYPGESSATLPGPIEHEVIEAKDFQRVLWTEFNPVQVLKAIACFEYQSCEHSEWEKSEAYQFCKALRHTAINALVGYSDASWGAPEVQNCRLQRIA